MRVSWKAVADNLSAYMTREVMQSCYVDMRQRIGEMNRLGVTESHEYAAVVQTMKFMGECIAEYDADFTE